MGLALARSITSSIHELFMGTERVRQGDFTHRIEIQTKDQLGELAESFNQMTGSIEHLLQTAAEKKRLEEELRIARQIQMSLLPRGPLDVPGLGDHGALRARARSRRGLLRLLSAAGRPARRPDRGRLGQGHVGGAVHGGAQGAGAGAQPDLQSPRQLLIEVNRIISANLDSRSFITMTYAVIDLHGRHPDLRARRPHAADLSARARRRRRAAAQVLTPSGMVLGLRIDGAAEKFDELLEEERDRAVPATSSCSTPTASPRR